MGTEDGVRDWVSPADDRSDSTAAFMVYVCALGAVGMPSVFRPGFDPWEDPCPFSALPFEALAVVVAAAAAAAVVTTRDAETRGGVEKPGCLGMCWGGGGCT